MMTLAAAVGIVLVYAGVVKLLDMRRAQHAVQEHMPWIPCHRLAAVASLLAGFEAGAGLALVVGVVPIVALPVVSAFLLIATGFSIRSLRAGSGDDCGCYGSIRVPVRVSIVLNVAYLALLIISARSANPFARPREGVGALATGVIVGIIAWRTRRKPIRDLSPVHVGGRWRPAWSGGAMDLMRGERMIVLLRGSCPHCELWVPFVNIYARNADVPTTAIVAVDAGGADAFAIARGATFPVTAIDTRVFDAIAPRTPMGVHLRDGRITAIWTGRVPPDLIAVANDYYCRLFEPADAASEMASSSR